MTEIERAIRSCEGKIRKYKERLCKADFHRGSTMNAIRLEQVKIAALRRTAEEDKAREEGQKTAYDEKGVPYLVEAEGSEAKHIIELLEAEEQGRLVVLPCKVGQTVWVISKCENVRMNRDDDYFTGTGAVECPFESSCDTEDCNDNHIRIFETVLSDFWYGDENGKRPEMFLEDMGVGYMRSDFGKTVFLTRQEAEAALGAQKGADQ